MTENERIAQVEIKNILGACAQTGDARKADAYAECYAKDAVLILGSRIEGREAIRQWMAARAAPAQPGTAVPDFGGFVSHHLTSCNVTVTSDTTATVKTYWLVITGIGLDHSGYYDDLFVKEDDAWRISSRHPRVLWISPQSMIIPRQPA